MASRNPIRRILFQWLIAAAFVALLAFLLLPFSRFAEASVYQLTPVDRITAEAGELNRIGGFPEVRAYADRDSCLSAHQIGDQLVLYWWCERFYMIREVAILDSNE